MVKSVIEIVIPSGRELLPRCALCELFVGALVGSDSSTITVGSEVSTGRVWSSEPSIEEVVRLIVGSKKADYFVSNLVSLLHPPGEVVGIGVLICLHGGNKVEFWFSGSDSRIDWVINRTD